MEKFIVQIDSDGVIANIGQKWAEIYNYRYGDDISPDVFCMGNELTDFVKPECGKRIYDIIKEPGFFAKLNPLPGAVECLERLSKNPRIDCYVLTDYSGDPNIAKGKIEFYQNYFPFFDTERIILCKPKFLVVGNVLIDDSLDNLVEYGAFQAKMHNVDYHTIWVNNAEDPVEDRRIHVVDTQVTGIKQAVDYIENILL